MDASRRGDDRGKEGVTQGVARVASPIFLNLHPSPLIEREINVLMEQGAIQRGVVKREREQGEEEKAGDCQNGGSLCESTSSPQVATAEEKPATPAAWSSATHAVRRNDISGSPCVHRATALLFALRWRRGAFFR